MNIKEIIVNQSHPTNESWDDVVAYGKNVATGVGNLATRAGKAAIDPETYKQAGRDIAAGAKFAVNNPGQAAFNVAQTADDAVRAGTNALTFGYADKLAGMGDAAVKGTNTDTEIKKQYGKSADALERSPIASEVGELASYAVPLAPATLGAKIAVKGATKILPKVLDTTAKKSINIGGKGTAVAGGGVAGDLAAKEVATQFDPNNPKLKEGSWGSKILGLIQKDVRAGAASGAKANKLSTAAGQPPTPAPGSLKPPTMTGGKGPTSPASTGTLGPTPQHISNPSVTPEPPSNPSMVRKLAKGAVNKAKNIAITGATLYGANKVAQQYMFTDPDKHLKDLGRAENERLDALAKQNEPEQDTEQQPQPTNPTNEASKELERVKYLTKYRA